jgi:pyruvate formate lyase activating enzyme
MRITGLEKQSTVDYPGELSAVVFTPGCNMDCWYCHNRHLLHPADEDRLHDEADVLDFLRRRRLLLDAVVVTGGEPTLQKDLPDFLAKLKALGYKVKLDTNGTAPWLVRDLIARELIDYLAMDVKAPLSRYADIDRAGNDTRAIGQTVDLLLQGRVEYEFRTTFAPTLSIDDILAIAFRLRGARRYVLQQYRSPGRSVDLFGLAEPPAPHPDEVVAEAALLAGRFVRHCSTRGLLPLPQVRQSTPTQDLHPASILTAEPAFVSSP